MDKETETGNEIQDAIILHIIIHKICKKTLNATNSSQV